MPSAMSSAIEPVGITAIGTLGRSPRRITEPLPNCLSICARATPSAFSRSGPVPAMSATPGRVTGFVAVCVALPAGGAMGGVFDRVFCVDDAAVDDVGVDDVAVVSATRDTLGGLTDRS